MEHNLSYAVPMHPQQDPRSVNGVLSWGDGVGCCDIPATLCRMCGVVNQGPILNIRGRIIKGIHVRLAQKCFAKSTSTAYGGHEGARKGLSSSELSHVVVVQHISSQNGHYKVASIDGCFGEVYFQWSLLSTDIWDNPHAS